MCGKCYHYNGVECLLREETVDKQASCSLFLVDKDLHPDAIKCNSKELTQ